MFTLTDIMFKGMVNTCTEASCLYEWASCFRDDHQLYRDLYRDELYNYMGGDRVGSDGIRLNVLSLNTLHGLESCLRFAAVIEDE